MVPEEAQEANCKKNAQKKQEHNLKLRSSLKAHLKQQNKKNILSTLGVRVCVGSA